MTLYLKLVAGLSTLALALTTQSTAYWPGLLLLLSSAAFGDMLQGVLFDPGSAKSHRPLKWAVFALTLTTAGYLFQVVLLMMVGLTLAFSFLFASLARDAATLERA